MASEHSSSGPALHEMTPVSISSGLVPNPSPSTPFVPPSRYDWDLLFQLMFDESPVVVLKSFGCDHNLPTMALDSIKFQCTVITKALLLYAATTFNILDPSI
ncbi:hypothetical protein Tco_0293225 [Tanacetum coccineum]